MSFRWIVSPDEVWTPNVNIWLDDIHVAMKTLMDSMVPEVILWMQNNASWDDKTGAARSGLSAEVFDVGGYISLSVFHTVDYGYYLEVTHEGQFAILGRTVDLWGVRFWLRVKQVMS